MGKSLNGKELGTGITQRKDGTYQARFMNRFGKRQSLYAKTQTEITRKLREAQYEDQKQINVVTCNMTLNEWYEVWMETCKKNCKDTTRRTYAIQYERLRQGLGWRKLTNLNKINIQQVFNELKTDASRRSCKSLLVDILNCAVDADLLVKNCAVSVKTELEKQTQKEKRILSDEEVQILYKETIEDSSMYPFFVVALNTGMRCGEIIGLTWDCVDFEKNEIHVEKTLCYLPSDGRSGIYELHPPKTEAGNRTIPMTKVCREALLIRKNTMEQVLSRHEPQKGFENLVFASKTNRPLNASNIKIAVNYIVARINRKSPDLQFEHFTPHCLRHTFATNCIEAGMRPKTLQKILGHSSLKTTMDLYCHVRPKTLYEELQLVGEMA